MVIEPRPEGDGMSAKEVYRQVVESVVGVETSADDGTGLLSQGSGIVATKSGYIITNAHVVEYSKDYNVTVTLHEDETAYDAVVVGYDKTSDLAILKIEADNLKPAVFGDVDQMEIGDEVLAIGNPGGLDFASTLTGGYISALNRTLKSNSDNGMTYIQTDAAINPGNSGGPLINIRGEIIGINKSILPNTEKSYTGIGFAIPSNLVQHSFQQICVHGRPMRGYLGLDIVPNTPPLRSFLDYHEATGAVVNMVKSGSPAEQAGLRTGDVMLNFNEVPILNVQDVLDRIENLSIGDKFRLKIWRKGQKMNLTLKVGDSILQNAPSPWADFMDGVGMHLRELTAEEQSIGARGLLVIQVNPKKSVGQILQTGDMVFAVNHQSVSTMEALVKALREGPALLTVSRDGQQFNVKVDARPVSEKTLLPRIPTATKNNAILPREL